MPGGGNFDLPTDAQWEYACRAGSTDAYCFGNNQRQLNEYAWSKLNADARVHDVGLLKPNAWGLYDMHGLEFEFVRDGYRRYTPHPVSDPVGPLDSLECVVRGGHWGRSCRRTGDDTGAAQPAFRDRADRPGDVCLDSLAAGPGSTAGLLHPRPPGGEGRSDGGAQT